MMLKLTSFLAYYTHYWVEKEFFKTFPWYTPIYKIP